MKYESIAQMAQRNQRDREKGVQHTPLHTLQECCEEAHIHPTVFGRYAAKYPGAPQPVVTNAKAAWRAGSKYYRKSEFVRWVNQVRQHISQSKQKEKVMPDLKSELSKVLNAWEHTAPEPEPMPETTPSQKPYFTTTNNVCRATFECIKKNPGKTRKELYDALLESGYKKSSTTSLVGQMLRQGLVRETGGLLFAAIPEYAPLKSSKVWANQQAKKEGKPQRKVVEITNKRTGEVINPRSAPAAQINSVWDADVMLNSLSIVQARALYDSLRKIFGG